MLLCDYLSDGDTPSRSSFIAALSRDLRVRLGDGARIIASPSERRLYSRDLADLPVWMERLLLRSTPHLVVQPEDARQISAVVSFASERRIPVVPRGIASTAFGGPVPTRNGIVLDLSPMKRIGFLSKRSSPTITVEAGARFGEIEDRIAPHGYTLAVYPSNRWGTVGGWISGGGYGVNALKYGHASQWVEAVEVVTMDGAIRWARNGESLFDRFLGSEGQMGIISRVTLRLLPRPEAHVPHLLTFESEGAALDFVAELASRCVRPATITFFGDGLLRLLNRLHRVDHPVGQPVQLPSQSAKEERGTRPVSYLPDRPSLLVYCDDASADSGLRAMLQGRPYISQADRERAGHLWADRYFPMKIRRLGPALLAGQVVVPLGNAAGFLEEAERLASRWRVRLAVEAHILPASAGALEAGKSPGEALRALIIMMFPTDPREQGYAAHTLLVSQLDRLGSKWKGQPYNLGLWHVPLVGAKYSKDRLAELVSAKRELDPLNLLNPGKFPRLRSRFGGVPGLLFRPRLFDLGVSAAAAIAPLIAPIPGGEEDAALCAAQTTSASRFHVAPEPVAFTADPSPDLLLTAVRCTSCGNCISVCPAYLQTRDERTTARGKLWLARRVAAGSKPDLKEAAMAFLCMRCRACSEVCQAQLPLMEAWEQLESLLEAHYPRPAEAIRRFLAETERNPEYAQLIGLRRPSDVLAQPWLKPAADAECGTARPTQAPMDTGGAQREERGNAHRPRGGKFHIETCPAPPPKMPVVRFRLERNDFCVNCGHCGEACVYQVHSRSPSDLRRMAAPEQSRCRACFRCVLECPRQALSISLDPAFAAAGHGPYSPELVFSLARQADEGSIPVTGAGYRGRFAGEGFEGMWTDMSEIVRPTRDGIHGREYISTAIDVGRRPTRLALDDRGRLARAVPTWIEIPIPILFQIPRVHAEEPKVGMAVRLAARRLSTFVLGQTSPVDGLVQVDDRAELIRWIPLLKRSYPCVVVVRVPLGRAAVDRVEELTRAGVEVVHLAAEWDGTCKDGTSICEALPLVHQRLVAENLRDEVTLLASGGIAAAEHVPKAVILGADGVVIDLPLLAALECPLSRACFEGKPCAWPLHDMDVLWGQQRIVNLMGSWRNQLLEVLGAMGMREVRRLRGERGRAMFAKKLEAELLAPLHERQ